MYLVVTPPGARSGVKRYESVGRNIAGLGPRGRERGQQSPAISSTVAIPFPSGL